MTTKLEQAEQKRNDRFAAHLTRRGFTMVYGDDLVAGVFTIEQDSPDSFTIRSDEQTPATISGQTFRLDARVLRTPKGNLVATSAFLAHASAGLDGHPVSEGRRIAWRTAARLIAERFASSKLGTYAVLDAVRREAAGTMKVCRATIDRLEADLALARERMIEAAVAYAERDAEAKLLAEKLSPSQQAELGGAR